MKRFSLFLSAAALSMCLYAQSTDMTNDRPDSARIQYYGIDPESNLHSWQLTLFKEKQVFAFLYLNTEKDCGIEGQYPTQGVLTYAEPKVIVRENGFRDTCQTCSMYGSVAINYNGRTKSGYNKYYIHGHVGKAYEWANSWVSVAGVWVVYHGGLDCDIVSGSEVTIPSPVMVTPAANSVEIAWAKVEDAALYDLKIFKAGELVFEIIFDENGIAELIDRHNAPARVRGAKQVAGFAYTVEGLEEGVEYTYSIDAKSSTDEVITHQTGEFSTSITPTAIDQITNHPSPSTQKFLRNGQILILRGDKTYTLTGQELK